MSLELARCGKCVTRFVKGILTGVSDWFSAAGKLLLNMSHSGLFLANFNALPMDQVPSSSTNTSTPLPQVTTSGYTPSPVDLSDLDQTIKIKAPGAGMMAFNRYRLERVIGRGGMGVVWLAEDLKLERQVALKFLPSLLGLDPAAVKELKTETRRGLELSHPHIVRIYDFVDDDEAAAISMEFIDGKTLSDLRLSRDPIVFTVAEIAAFLPGICDALDYAHFQRKVVHRDLKPANIMVTAKDGVAKIADFGIARSLSDTMSRLSAAHIGTSGTLPYMSPQQAMGERPLPTDDVYSLGATIYELISGKPPFYRGDLPMQINSKIPASMKERREELEITATDVIPAEWESVIALCLHKDPSQRPQSAGAMAALLGIRTSSSSSTITSLPQSITHPSAVQPAKKSSLPTVAAMAAGVSLAGLVGFYIASNKETPVSPASPVSSISSSPTATELPPASAPNPTPESPETPVVMTSKTEPVATPASTAPAEAQSTEPAKPEPEMQKAAEAVPAVAATPSASIPPAVAPLMPPNGIYVLPITPTTPAQTTMPAATPVVDPTSVQPPVTEPPEGFWTVQQMFPVLPQASYSENGKRQLLYKAQGLLKEQGFYNATHDGKEGKGTHNAIVLFQARNSLIGNGLLDGPTLKAMNLAGLPDDPEWQSPAMSSGVRKKSYSSKSKAPEDQSILQKAGKSIGRFFGKD